MNADWKTCVFTLNHHGHGRSGPSAPSGRPPVRESPLIWFRCFWIAGFVGTGTRTFLRASTSGTPRSTSSWTSRRHCWCAATFMPKAWLNAQRAAITLPLGPGWDPARTGTHEAHPSARHPPLQLLMLDVVLSTVEVATDNRPHSCPDLHIHAVRPSCCRALSTRSACSSARHRSARARLTSTEDTAWARVTRARSSSRAA